MDKLLEDLKREHQVIDNLLIKIRRLGIHTREGRNELLAARKQLLTHLERGMEELYPELQAAAKTNPNLKGILENFQNEMEDISAFCTDFFKKYSMSGGGIDFFRDFEKLKSSVHNRMREEETLLALKQTEL